MRKVIGIGETVLDIIFKNEQPIGAYPGGSIFNGIISLGRCGIESTFISEAGNDRVGEHIVEFLKENGVNADNVCTTPESKSPISLAFLDENNEAQYLFYKDHPHDQLDFVYPDIQPDDIVVIGSYYAVNPVIRPQIVGLLDLARNHGAIIYYDVNYRPAHKSDALRITPNLLENYEYADIVRGSYEDFLTLYKMEDSAKVYNAEISFYCKNFIYTHGSQPVVVRSGEGFIKNYDVPKIDTVSTIGAGDNFNAGLLYGLLKYDIKRDEVLRGLTESQWDELIGYGLRFSAESCKSIYNYVSKDFGALMKEEFNK